MTEKLYYNDAYISEFDAEVLESSEENKRQYVVLDRTAFFPEGGGQSSDKGRISDFQVYDVQEKNGVIYHFLKGNIKKGEKVHCIIDFKERYEKMQCHTAEHILSGTIYKLFGFNNVGFHLGSDYVTFDIDAVLDRDMLDRVELVANKAVFENVEVKTYFPKKEELHKIEYRAKLDLHENVRIVKIGSYDSCACCAPHVSRTGEIGIIKILDFEKHRGGVRVFMTAGYRALYDYRERYMTSLRISALLSTPQKEIGDAVEKLVYDYETEKHNSKEALLSLSRCEAEKLTKTDKNKVCCFPNMNMDGLREFAKCATSKVGGILVSLCGKNGDFKYVITSESVNLSKCVKDINSSLGGRGGGRPEMIQGTFSESLSRIKEYFEN